MILIELIIIDLSEIVTDKSIGVRHEVWCYVWFIYLFTVYTDESCSYYGNRSKLENILRSPKINFVN